MALLDTDPVLRLIPAEGMPDTFRAMPEEEQKWRGRYFLMTWVLSRHTAYAWSIALAEPEESGKATVAGIEDEAILAGLRGSEAEAQETVA